MCPDNDRPLSETYPKHVRHSFIRSLNISLDVNVTAQLRQNCMLRGPEWYNPFIHWFCHNQFIHSFIYASMYHHEQFIWHYKYLYTIYMPFMCNLYTLWDGSMRAGSWIRTRAANLFTNWLAWVQGPYACTHLSQVIFTPVILGVMHGARAVLARWCQWLGTRETKPCPGPSTGLRQSFDNPFDNV